jgi:hypothetical protein
LQRGAFTDVVNIRRIAPYYSREEWVSHSRHFVLNAYFIETFRSNLVSIHLFDTKSKSAWGSISYARSLCLRWFTLFK